MDDSSRFELNLGCSYFTHSSHFHNTPTPPTFFSISDDGAMDKITGDRSIRRKKIVNIRRNGAQKLTKTKFIYLPIFWGRQILGIRNS